MKGRGESRQPPQKGKLARTIPLLRTGKEAYLPLELCALQPRETPPGLATGANIVAWQVEVAPTQSKVRKVFGSRERSLSLPSCVLWR